MRNLLKYPITREEEAIRAIRQAKALIAARREAQNSRIERLRTALLKIADCQSVIPGDIVDIARKAINEDR